MKFYSINDPAFAQYGRRMESPFYQLFKDGASTIDLPQSGSMYHASEQAFETPQAMAYYKQLFGELDVQIGYCYGWNDSLNALEWHKNSEMSVALTDLVMLLGDIREMQDGKYDSAKVKAFLLKPGDAVEIYATTLHFCPINVKDQPFKNVVILPRGTNTPLDEAAADKRLIAKNKWLIIHPEFHRQVALGREIGVVGENIKITW